MSAIPPTAPPQAKPLLESCVAILRYVAALEGVPATSSDRLGTAAGRLETEMQALYGVATQLRLRDTPELRDAIAREPSMPVAQIALPRPLGPRGRCIEPFRNHAWDLGEVCLRCGVSR